MDLTRENSIYKEQMTSLRKELELKEEETREDFACLKTLKHFFKFRKNWEANFLETIKLFEYVLDFSSENNFFYLDSSCENKKSIKDIIPPLDGLVANLQKGFICFQESFKQVGLQLSREPSEKQSPSAKLRSSSKQLKRMQKEDDLSISNEFKLDLGFIKEDFLHKNYAFDVPNTSEEGSAVSKNLLSIQSKDSKNIKDKNVVYICSIEQQLSSDKKSYVQDKNTLGQIKNGFVLMEGKSQPEELKKKQLYNNIFQKQSKNKSITTIESEEIDTYRQKTQDKETKPTSIEKTDIENITTEKENVFNKDENPFITQELYISEENNVYKPETLTDHNLIQSVSKNSIKQDLISNSRTSNQDYQSNKIMENFSFNFNDQNSFLRIKNNKIDKNLVANKSNENLFKNQTTDSLKSISIDESSSIKKEMQPSFNTHQGRIKLVESEILKKSQEFKIEANYFNIRPKGYLVKKKQLKLNSQSQLLKKEKKLKSILNKKFKFSPIGKGGSFKASTPKPKQQMHFNFEKENKSRKSLKFIKKRKPFAPKKITASMNLGNRDISKKGRLLVRTKDKNKSRISYPSKNFRTSPCNLIYSMSHARRSNPKKSKLFSKGRKSPIHYQSNISFSQYLNGAKKKRFKTPKNALESKKPIFLKRKLKTLNKKYVNSFKISNERSFRLNRKKSCNLHQKPYDSFVLHVNNKYSTKNLIKKNDIINLSFIK